MSDKIAIIGLGYVGLPLAVAFAEKYKVVGFDINESRVNELNSGHDHTLEVEDDLLKSVLTKKGETTGLLNSADVEDIRDCNIYIVTVPTPVDKFNNPDLTPLIKASQMIGELLVQGDIIIYESTVYPGCTEEDCVPVLEQTSGLKFNTDFFCGYSPERINPGDKKNTLKSIKKVTSGSTPEIAERVNELYLSIIEAGTHLAPNMKVAEASKAIENAQRDINISFVNELALIFDRMGIDTNDVLDAAGTKWNFLKYKPGLVGGHCIGVDPYYLKQKAQMLGYYPAVISSGRKVNDSIGEFIGGKVIKLLIQRGVKVVGSKCLILGVTFKENCPDIRNTRVVDIIDELKDYGVEVDVYDTWADSKEVNQELKLELLNEVDLSKYDSIVLAVSHDEFKDLDWSTAKGVIYDVKAFLPREVVDGRL
ncbi:MAG: nucleotide sugar dehydrogenase [Roseivirga sp.]|uniref:nucleotide sugar dehydrogenase n=1 Tax=Roseivirga sp. TaxID=1964215 RepID=UPI001B08CB99|nr:nucleotide sugar dehydrogenase [Roseivirga sp.]MBO6660996.1 nucleotide sugar dehydrogenase [Roseivirga sp.]MBO6760058.1 nucleotide sugar dehydrogenase [Roseivirga sp.]MBO6909020.1 nucleotide sugar dehydrogenase [Roseivirga sp.]